MPRADCFLRVSETPESLKAELYNQPFEKIVWLHAKFLKSEFGANVLQAPHKGIACRMWRGTRGHEISQFFLYIRCQGQNRQPVCHCRVKADPVRQGKAQTRHGHSNCGRTAGDFVRDRQYMPRSSQFVVHNLAQQRRFIQCDVSLTDKILCRHRSTACELVVLADDDTSSASDGDVISC